MPQVNDKVLRFKVIGNSANIVYAVPLDDLVSDVLTADNLLEHLQADEPITLTKSASGTYLTIGFNDEALKGLSADIAAAKTEVTSGDNIKVTESKAEDGHTIYEISGLSVPDAVDIVSSDNSINIEKSTIDGTSTYDLKINDTEFGEAEYGKFVKYGSTSMDKVGGNISNTGDAITLTVGQVYHFDVNLYITNVDTTDEVFFGHIKVNNVDVNGFTGEMDRSIHGSLAVNTSFLFIPTETSNVITLSDGLGNTLATSFLAIDVHRVSGLTASGGSGGSGDNNKVAVDASSDAGFLEQVLVSSSDVISLIKQNGQLRINYNSDLTSDPKLSTIDESQINSAGTNYGGYSLKDGYDSIVWGDNTNTSYNWLNAKLSQYQRISSAQGTITKCNIVLAGTLSGTKPCINVGIFDNNGVLLGQSGLIEYGKDFSSGNELLQVDMHEEYAGSLNIARNTRYYIQVWTVGVQLAAMAFNNTLNYSYNYNLRQNLTAEVKQPTFVDPITYSFNGAEYVDFVSFGASPIE